MSEAEADTMADIPHPLFYAWHPHVALGHGAYFPEKKKKPRRDPNFTTVVCH